MESCASRNGQWWSREQVYWGLTPFPFLIQSHQFLQAIASTKHSACWHQPFKWRRGMMGKLNTARDSDWGQLVRKWEWSSHRTQMERDTPQGRLYCNVHPLATLLLLSHLPFPTAKVSHSEKRIMMCWGRENFLLPQAVKHLSWAVLKCQHKCVLVYRKKSIIIRNHSCYCIS